MDRKSSAVFLRSIIRSSKVHLFQVRNNTEIRPWMNHHHHHYSKMKHMRESLHDICPLYFPSWADSHCCPPVLVDGQRAFCVRARIGPDVKTASDNRAVSGLDLGGGTGTVLCQKKLSRWPEYEPDLLCYLGSAGARPMRRACQGTSGGGTLNHWPWMHWCTSQVDVGTTTCSWGCAICLVKVEKRAPGLKSIGLTFCFS